MANSSDSPPNQSIPVSLQLPADLAAAIRQRATAQGRSPTQIIIELLRSGLFPEADTSTSDSNPSGLPLEQLVARVSALESVLPRVNALEERLNDLLERSWAKGQAEPELQDAARSQLSNSPIANSPIANSPIAIAIAATPASTVASICPQCGVKLGAPLKSSGRQVCSQCGWTNRPRHSTGISPRPSPEQPSGSASAKSESSHSEPSNADLYSILAQASEDSLNNMKRQKTSQKPTKKTIQDLLNESDDRDL
jgi:hypothetical protein